MHAYRQTGRQTEIHTHDLQRGADGTEELWYAPDMSEEEALYAAAIDDALLSDKGEALPEYVLQDGRTVQGSLNLQAECLRQDYTLVTPQQVCVCVCVSVCPCADT